MMTSPLTHETEPLDTRTTSTIVIRGSLRTRVTAAALVAALAGFASVALAAGYVETDLVANQSPLTDSNGIVHTPTKPADSALQNPWGVAFSPTSPFWVSDNGAGLSTLYAADGTKVSLVVTIPAPGGDPNGNDGAPTGLVFNSASGAGAFKITGCTSAGVQTSLPAVFLFSTEDGTIVGWNPNLTPIVNGACPAFTPPSTHAIIAATTADAIYKGLAIGTANVGAGSPPTAVPVLYATNFHAGTVDVFDASFATPPNLDAAAFTDPKLPKGYAPFNIVPVGTRLFVTYAVQDEDAEDDVAGQGHGVVDTFTAEGSMIARFAQHGQLNSPWGVALAPATFGEAGGQLLIGNFGDGHINIFDPATGEFLDKLRNTHGQALVIDGLWTIVFHKGPNTTDPQLLYFTAGPNDEADGLFGNIAPGP